MGSYEGVGRRLREQLIARGYRRADGEPDAQRFCWDHRTAGEETSGRSSTSSHHAAPTPAQPENTMMDKRTFLKQAWVWPVIATFAVTPSMARAGSNDVEAEAETTWTIDYTVRGDISQVNKFYGTGAYLFLKTPDSIPVYLQQGGWQYQGVYGHVMLPDGLPAISFVGPYDQAIASRP